MSHHGKVCTFEGEIRRTVLFAATVLLLSALATAPAQANCMSARLITFESFIYTPGFPLGTGYLGSTVSPDFQGGFWALGGGDPVLGEGADSGSFAALQDGWIYAGPAYPAGGGTRPDVSLTWAGSSKIDGCIDFVGGDRCMAMLLMDQNTSSGYFWLGTDAPDTLINYLLDLPDEAAVNLVPVPPPVLLDVEPAGQVFQGPSAADVVSALDLDPDCSQDVVIGFKVYRQFGPSPPTDYTRDDGLPGGWELHPGSIGPGEPAPLDSSVTLEPFCPVGSFVYYATSLVFDSGFETAYLSAASPGVACACDGEDADGDGFCAGDHLLSDCDDTDATVYPDAPQVCDVVNNNCLSPSWPVPPPGVVDDDGDGFAECEGDCSDDAPSVYPGAPELCDGLNNDCNAADWPDIPIEEADIDGDGAAPCGGDCDEGDNTVYSGAPEVCDNQNNDCDDPNWPAIPAAEFDTDGDGFRLCAGDCDEALSTVFPLAPQICGDGLNNDCNHPAWPQLSGTNEVDIDGDGQSECAGDCDETNDTVFAGAPEICADALNNDCNDPNWPVPPDDQIDHDGDGLSICAGDCDDAEFDVFPGAPEICDGLNNDCNDPDWPTPPVDDRDADGDEFPACNDCDDASSATYAGATQVCDGLNNDCLDPAWPQLSGTNEVDIDGDGQSECAGDCDEMNDAVFAGAPEICADALNNNCDDPNWPVPPDDQLDNDGDGLSICLGDCNDTHVDVFPGAPQICDGLNNDCNDPTWPTPPVDDRDGDGDAFPACGDCDDTSSTTYPGATQVCDGVNNDCLSPGWPGLDGTTEVDDDGDGLSECEGDCDDTHAAVFPGAAEICGNGLDDDCDGLIDFAGIGIPILLAELSPGDASPFDRLGTSVALSVETLVIGAPFDGDVGPQSGSAYVYERDAGNAGRPGRVSKLNASDGALGDHFGSSVSISRDTVVVGSPRDDDAGNSSGSAYVYDRDIPGFNDWDEVAKLTADDAAAGHEFGRSVSISGDRAVVGAPVAEHGGIRSGAAYIYERDRGGADNWGQVAKLTPTVASEFDSFGQAVSISGDTVVIGMPDDDDAASSSGSAYVFQRDMGGVGNWGQVAKLTAPDAAESDFFGGSVSISGDTIVVGALGGDGAVPNSGSAYVFQRGAGGLDNWGQVARLTAADGTANAQFGESVSINRDIVVVGAPFVGAAVYMFERNSGSVDGWGQVAKMTDAEGTLPGFGKSVSVEGETVVVGHDGDDVGGTASGSSFLFSFRCGDCGDGIVDTLEECDDGNLQNGDGCSSTCLLECEDRDNDGVGAIGSSLCPLPGVDCDDTNPNAYPGATQVCDGFNNDCLDPVWPDLTGTNEGDADQDGISECAGDCDDTRPGVFPGAQEICGNGLDDDCDGLIDPTSVVRQVDKLSRNDGSALDRFGSDIALNGQTIVIGARFDGDLGVESGSVYVYERDAGNAGRPGRMSKLNASDASPSDRFGRSVSISGDTVVVGAINSRTAYVYQRTAPEVNIWDQRARLTPSGAAAQFGRSVSISGDTVVVGDPIIDAVYVYRRDAGGPDNWGQVAILSGADLPADVEFGRAVSIRGDSVVVGAPPEDTGVSDSGSAYVFHRNAGGADNWGQVAELTTSEEAAQFGGSVSIDGTTVVVGAWLDGSAFVFERDAGGDDGWGQVARLTASSATAQAEFGRSVSISGDKLVVGAPGDDVLGPGSGSAFVFRRGAGGADRWGQEARLTADDGAEGAAFGASVAIHGESVLVGADRDDAEGQDAGAAYLFNFNLSCAVCGDGIVDDGEECDDGNNTAGDGCDEACLVE